MRLTDPVSGFSFSGNGAHGERFAASLATSLAEDRAREAVWVAGLIGDGVAAAHPDDGWVNRERNSVHFCYPQFDHGPKVGDLIALGHHDKYRLVEVVKIIPWVLTLPGERACDYYFSAETAEKEKMPK